MAAIPDALKLRKPEVVQINRNPSPMGAPEVDVQQVSSMSNDMKMIARQELPAQETVPSWEPTPRSPEPDADPKRSSGGGTSSSVTSSSSCSSGSALLVVSQAQAQLQPQKPRAPKNFQTVSPLQDLNAAFSGGGGRSGTASLTSADLTQAPASTLNSSGSAPFNPSAPARSVLPIGNPGDVSTGASGSASVDAATANSIGGQSGNRCLGESEDQDLQKAQKKLSDLAALVSQDQDGPRKTIRNF